MAQAEKEAEGGDIRRAELTLDRACFEEMSELAGATGNDFLSSAMSLCGSTRSICARSARARMARQTSFCPRALLPGGHIPAEQLKTARGDRLAELTRAAARSAAGELAAATLGGSGSLTAFERACDDALVRYLQRARRTPFGPEVIGLSEREGRRNSPLCAPFYPENSRG